MSTAYGFLSSFLLVPRWRQCVSVSGRTFYGHDLTMSIFSWPLALLLSPYLFFSLSQSLFVTGRLLHKKVTSFISSALIVQAPGTFQNRLITPRWHWIGKCWPWAWWRTGCSFRNFPACFGEHAWSCGRKDMHFKLCGKFDSPVLNFSDKRSLGCRKLLFTLLQLLWQPT